MKKIIYLSLMLALLFMALVGCQAIGQTADNSSAGEWINSTSESIPGDTSFISPSGESAASTPVIDYEYEENENGITITKYTGNDVNVVIPDTIDGKPVTEIGRMAFFENNIITSVKLPKTMRTIRSLAFSRCSFLNTVVLLDGVKSIENSAFEFCIALSEITLPNTLTTLGEYVFNNCASLKYIRIPSSLTSWGFDAFSVSGLETVELENGLNSIGFSAFRDTNIKEIILPESVKEISELAFSNCPKLESITLNEGLTTIKDGAFRASSLTEIIIPATVENISESAFAYCDALLAIKFEGNAPRSFVDPENPINGSYTIYYHEGAEGFSTPEWSDYQTKNW